MVGSLIDSTPFQPAETRIYRIRKQGMLLAEKSSSALSNVTSPLVQPTRPIAREERRSQTTLRIYPNPAEDKAAISVTLDSPQRIRLILTDVLGKTIQTIYEGESNPGELVFTTRLEAIPTGVYWIRLLSENNAQTLPLVIRK